MTAFHDLGIRNQRIDDLQEVLLLISKPVLIQLAKKLDISDSDKQADDCDGYAVPQFCDADALGYDLQDRDFHSTNTENAR